MTRCPRLWPIGCLVSTIISIVSGCAGAPSPDRGVPVAGPGWFASANVGPVITRTDAAAHAVVSAPPVATAQAAATPVPTEATRATDAADRPLRVVTFNMLHGGPWSERTGDDAELERRLEIVAAELARVDPDVVALQEASVGRRRGNVAARLAARLGLHHVHAAATERVFHTRLIGRPIVWLLGFAEGPAILSRFPIVATETLDLPRCALWYDPRVLLGATLRTPAGDLRVYSTHTVRDDCQLEAIGRLVTARRNGLPSMVMGDLNMTDAGPGMQALLAAGFVDAYRAANPDDTGATVWQPVRSAVPSASRRVDYVLLLPGQESRARVSASRVILKTPARLPDGGTLWPSDHHGVLAEIALPRAGDPAQPPSLPRAATPPGGAGTPERRVSTPGAATAPPPAR